MQLDVKSNEALRHKYPYTYVEVWSNYRRVSVYGSYEFVAYNIPYFGYPSTFIVKFEFVVSMIKLYF